LFLGLREYKTECKNCYRHPTRSRYIRARKTPAMWRPDGNRLSGKPLRDLLKKSRTGRGLYRHRCSAMGATLSLRIIEMETVPCSQPKVSRVGHPAFDSTRQDGTLRGGYIKSLPCPLSTLQGPPQSQICRPVAGRSPLQSRLCWRAHGGFLGLRVFFDGREHEIAMGGHGVRWCEGDAVSRTRKIHRGRCRRKSTFLPGEE
jgi:hypothetical protein